MGLSVLAWFAPWLLLRAVGGRSWRPRLALASLAGLVWSLGTVGSWLYPAARDTPPVLTVVSGHNLARDPLGEYLAASAAAEPAPLTIWPEAAVPGYLADEPRTAEAIARAARARGWLLLGAPRYDSSGPRRRYFNSALLFDGDGRLRQTYDKLMLVPFAERSPLPALASLTRPFISGSSAALLVTHALPF